MLSKPEYKYTVSIIIPNWNGKQLLKKCLPSLTKQSFRDFEVIVVDNGSMDGSVEYVTTVFPDFKVITLDKNYGFAKAVNIGIKESKSKYLFLLNNDTEVEENCLSCLVAAAKQHQDCGFIAARVRNFYHRERIDSAGDIIDAVGHAYNLGMGEKDGPKFSKPGYVFMVTAGGGLFKREVFNKAGLFDEDFNTYMEDVDLCFRAQLQGFKGWYQPKAIIYHIHKATSSRIKPMMEYWQFRNMTQMIIKDFPKGLFLSNFNWLKIILVNINTIFWMITQGYFWQGIGADWYILTHLPTLLKKRAQIQSKKVVNDDYIIKNIREKKITFYGLLKPGL